MARNKTIQKKKTFIFFLMVLMSLGCSLDIAPSGVAGEQNTQGAVNQLADELVADQGNNVGGEGLNVVHVPDRSGNCCRASRSAPRCW